MLREPQGVIIPEELLESRDDDGAKPLAIPGPLQGPGSPDLIPGLRAALPPGWLLLREGIGRQRPYERRG